MNKIGASMKIKDRIEFNTKPKVMTFKEADKAIKAVIAMSEKNYGASVIVDEHNKPIGIVTERDFMRRLLAKGLNPNTTLIKEIMTKDLRLAYSSDEIEDWLRIMSNERFRHLPIVDENGKLLNLMSQGDFVSYTWPQLIIIAKDNLARKFMQRFHLHLFATGLILYVVASVIVFMKL